MLGKIFNISFSSLLILSASILINKNAFASDSVFELRKKMSSFILIGSNQNAPDLVVYKKLISIVNQVRSVIVDNRSKLAPENYAALKTGIESINQKLGYYRFYLVTKNKTKNYINLKTAHYWRQSAVNDVKLYMEKLD